MCKGIAILIDDNKILMNKTYWYNEAQLMAKYINKKNLAKDFCEWVKKNKEKEKR